MVKYYTVEIRGDDGEVYEEYEITEDEASTPEAAEKEAMERWISFKEWTAHCILEEEG